jgi:hypothetical protein
MNDETPQSTQMTPMEDSTPYEDRAYTTINTVEETSPDQTGKMSQQIRIEENKLRQPVRKSRVNSISKNSLNYGNVPYEPSHYENQTKQPPTQEKLRIEGPERD